MKAQEPIPPTLKGDIKILPNSYIAFLDILGFKDLVTNNSHEELHELYEKTLLIFHQLLAHEFEDKKVQTFLKEQNNEFKLHSLLISDSIILWTEDTSPVCFTKLILTVSRYLDAFMLSGVPLRGAISMGPLSIFNNDDSKVLFGMGLVNAYKVESSQSWSGCVIDKICIEHFDRINTEIKGVNALKIDQIPHILKYDVPTKTGIVNSYVIDWRNAFKMNIDANYVRGAFSMHAKSIASDRIIEIIDNTCCFFDLAPIKKWNLPYTDHDTSTSGLI